MTRTKYNSDKQLQIIEIIIRGHHVYKETLTQVLNENLVAYHDIRQEEQEYDKHAIGVYGTKYSRMDQVKFVQDSL